MIIEEEIQELIGSVKKYNLPEVVSNYKFLTKGDLLPTAKEIYENSSGKLKTIAGENVKLLCMFEINACEMEIYNIYEYINLLKEERLYRFTKEDKYGLDKETKALIAFSVAYIIIAHSVDFPPEWLMIKINTIKETIVELQEDSMIVKVKAGNEVFNLRVIEGPKKTLRTTYQTVRILGKKAGTENIKLLHPEEGPIGVWIGGSRVGVIK